jgi:hypothetical protein
VEALRTRVREFVFTGIKPEQLGIVRILLGFGLIPFHLMQFIYFPKLDADGPAFHFISPIWYFDLLGIESVSITTTVVALVVLCVASASVGVGLFTRSSLIVMLVMILLLKGTRDSVAGDLHHRFLIPFNLLMLLLLSRCGDVWSVDAWRKRKRGTLQKLQEWEASWPVMSCQMYVATFYFISAVAKLRMSGWIWASSDRIKGLLVGGSARFGVVDGTPTGWGRVAFDIAQSDVLCSILGASTYVFEFGFPLILLISKTWLRVLFLAGVSSFHIANYFLINVQFLLLPVVFIVFFDLSRPAIAALNRWSPSKLRGAQS